MTTKGQFKMLRCALAGVQAVEATTRHTFARHTHEQFGIGVIREGAQKSHSGRGLVEAVSGNVITVNPGEVHDGAPVGDSARSWTMLYLDPALVAETISDLSEGKTQIGEFSCPVLPDARLARRFQQLFTLVTANEPPAGMLPEESLSLLLAEVMDAPGGSGRSVHIPRNILLLQKLIDENPTAPVTLSDLAEKSGLSRFQVLRGFARATGLTPHAYLVQRRIHVARQLIARGTPLAVAAATSGFADQSHMTRIFIKKYGISPGAFAGAIA